MKTGLTGAMIRLSQVLQTEPEDSLNGMIAKIVAQHLGQMEELSTNDMAKLCNVSKTSFIRFCRYMGYETFAEFKTALLSNQSDIHKKYPDSIPDFSGFAQDYLEQTRENLLWMKQNLDFQLLKNLAEDLLQHPNIYLFGNAQSGNSANNVMFSLLQMNRLAYVSTLHSEQKNLISHMKPDSTVIVLSNYGAFFETFVERDCFSQKPENTIVYLLTCNEQLERPAGVDHIILCGKDAGFSGGNFCIDAALNILLQYYRVLAIK